MYIGKCRKSAIKCTVHRTALDQFANSNVVIHECYYAVQINGKTMTRNSIYALASYGVNRLQILIVGFKKFVSVFSKTQNRFVDTTINFRCAINGGSVRICGI